MVSPEAQALELASGAACAICFGYVFSSQIKPSHAFMCLAEHLAAGIVLSATIFELAPIIPHGLDATEFAWVSVGLISGFLFLLLVRQFVGCHGHGDRKCEPGCGSGHAGCGIGTTYATSGIGSGFDFGFTTSRTGYNAPGGLPGGCMVIPTESTYASDKNAKSDPIAKKDFLMQTMFNRMCLCVSDSEKTSLLPSKPAKIAWNRIVAVWIDVTCDGFLVGIATVAQGDTHENPGFIVAVALAIEILFLGTIIAPVFSSRRALGLCVSLCCSLSILAAAFTGAHILSSFINTGPFYGFVAFGVSALVWLVCEELLLQSHVINGSRFWLTLTFFLGFYFVLLIRALEHAVDLSHGDVEDFSSSHHSL